MERESRTIEYKREITDLRKIAKTAIAFANGLGGEIIVGVDDAALTIRGLSSQTLDHLLETLPQSLADQITPALIPNVYTRTIDKKELLIIRVFPGSQKPYFLTSEGAEKGVYVRVGAHTRRAEGSLLEELRLMRSHMSYDEAPVTNCPITALELSLLPPTLRSKKALFSLDLYHQDPHTGQVSPTRGAVLMLCEEPTKYVSGAETIISRMRGESGRDTIESHDLTGPLVAQAEQAMDILGRWLGTNPKLSRSRMVNQKSKIPQVALREAVHNALFHRQYSIPGPVKIALYANRLEIFSPGAFAGPFIPDSLGDGTSYIRNRVICLLARRMNLIEKRGTGIMVIKRSVKDAQLNDPIFEEGPNWFKVTLSTERIPMNVGSNTSEIILDLFGDSPSITSTDVMKALSVSKATAIAYLEKLIASNQIKRVGKGPKTRYFVLGL